MKERSSSADLILSILAFVVVMALGLGALAGFGVGAPELIVWGVLSGVGIYALIRRNRAARVIDG